MLAAASSRSDRALDSVKLVLLLEAKRQAYPDTLKVYFWEVMRQTIKLLNNPSELASEAMPEAISLAVKLTADDQLRELVQNLLDDEDISSKQAEMALTCLETSFDSSGAGSLPVMSTGPRDSDFFTAC